jgi:hypothetical protein
VLEWSREQTRWQFLDPDSRIEDPALAVPLRVRALLADGKVDDDVAHALLMKGNSVLEAAMEDARETGIRHGKAEGIITLLVTRGVSLDATIRERILAEQNLAQLDRWIVRAASCRSTSELLAEL